MQVSPQNPGDKIEYVLCGSCPEASFDKFLKVRVSGKREFQALSATPCQLFYIRYIYPDSIRYNGLNPL
jgi:hypothetical protein